MFYQFLVPLQDSISFLRIFQYITFRSAYAIITSLILAFILTPYFIRWLKRLKFGEKIRDDGPASHMSKAGTPTMGGIAILIPMTISLLLWGNLENYYVLLLMGATILLGVIGFTDDYMKAVLHKPKGMSARMKLFLQLIIAFIFSLIIFIFPSNLQNYSNLFLPFINEPVLDFSSISIFGMGKVDAIWLYILLDVFIIVGSSNAVNLTDGLDGLAIGNSLIVVASFALLSYVTGHVKIAKYLLIPYVPHAAELTVLLAAFIGAGIGFLWFNSNPAQLFMGDTGSLAIGGLIGMVAILIKKEFLLPIVGGVFVLEALSVILQVGYYKWKKKRIFKMAPIHHHFELSGWAETKVVTRFWIIGFILALIAISSLKIL